MKLSKIVPWEQIEQRYAVQLNKDQGAPALSARIALGSLIIKEKLGLSDEETVEQIRENPCLQCFLGYEPYHDEQPFDPSMMVHFRKRLGARIVNEINELVAAPQASAQGLSGGSEEKTPDEKGDPKGDWQTAALHRSQPTLDQCIGRVDPGTASLELIRMCACLRVYSMIAESDEAVKPFKDWTP